MTKNKNDIIELVAARSGEKKEMTSKMVTETLTAIRSLICSGDPEMKLSIHDFGTFEIKTASAKANARNPGTNKPLVLPTRRKISFHPGKYIKAAFRDNNDE